MISSGDLVYVEYCIGEYIFMNGTGIILEKSDPDLAEYHDDCSHWWVFMNNEQWNISSKFIKKIKRW